MEGSSEATAAPTLASRQEQIVVDLETALNERNIGTIAWRTTLWFAVFEIIATSAVFAFIWDSASENCFTLKAWHIGYTIRWIIQLPVTYQYWALHNDSTRLVSCLYTAKFYQLAFAIAWPAMTSKNPQLIVDCPILYQYGQFQMLIYFLSLCLVPALLCIVVPLICFFGVQAPIAFLMPNQGISEVDLATIEVQAFNKDVTCKSSKFSDPCFECAICISEFKDDEEIRILSCDHRFHKGCVDIWLKNKAVCPLCRTPATGNNI